MAIVSVSENSEREGQIAASPQLGWVRNYKRTWTVITDSKDDGPITVMGSIPVAVGNVYRTTTESDLFSFCLSITPRCTTVDGLQWEVEVQYGPFDPTTRPENPLDQPPDVEWDFAQFTRIADQEADPGDGSTPKIIANSADVPFDPPVEIDDSRPVLRVSRNEATFDANLADELRDSVNQDSFLEWDPGTVKVMAIRSRRLWHPIPGYYWATTYELCFNRDGWSRKLLDAGKIEILSSGEYQQILDKYGVPVTEAVPLDGDGLFNDIGADPVYLEFHVYKMADFGLLNFDSIGPIVMGQQ